MEKEKYFDYPLTISYNNFRDAGVKVFRVKASSEEEARKKAITECRRLLPTCKILFVDNYR